MPNGDTKKLNFTLKVWDNTSKSYRPVYIAPDATDTVQGDVKLSDATNSTLNAANGMTAATPAAVKAVYDSANNKLDKISFDINWAVDENGKRVYLPGIHFVRVYTGVLQVCGWLGETSTELSKAVDLNLLEE